VEVFAINAADLRPSFYVQGPSSAFDFILDPSQDFVLAFNCLNAGQAGTHPGFVEIDVGNSGFQILTERVKEFGVGQEVPFAMRAAPNEILSPVDIWARIIDVPDDSNTNADSRISNDSLVLQFVVKELKPDLILEGFEGFSGQGIAGTEVIALRLFFYNRHNGSSYPISISGFELKALDQNGKGISFSGLASAMRLVDTHGAEAIGSISQSSAVFGNLSSIIIEPGARDTISFYLRFTDTLSQSGFALHVPSEGISALAVRDGIPQVDIDILTVSGNPVDITTVAAGLAARNLAESFGNYPNPFDPLGESCHFSYYLSQNSDISLRIYTLTGQPVWAVDYRGSDEHCLLGNHSGSSTLAPIEWNGRNGNGHIINNGIYIAVFKVAQTGEQVRTKVAVVK